MKTLKVLFFMLISCSAFAQITDPLLGYEVDSIYNDTTQQYDLFFTLSDTTGDVSSGNYEVKYTRLDSASFVEALYIKTLDQLNRMGSTEAARLNFIAKGVELRAVATAIIGQDLYRQSIAAPVRQSMTGQYVYRYNGAMVNLTADNIGRYRDSDTNLRLIVNPWSFTWVVAVDQVENEAIELYKISDTFWIGEGSSGRAILRKVN